jgi:hypothetical protein
MPAVLEEKWINDDFSDTYDIALQNGGDDCTCVGHPCSVVEE